MRLDERTVTALETNLLLCYTGAVRRNVGIIDRQIAMWREGREETRMGLKELHELAYAMREPEELRRTAQGYLEETGEVLAALREACLEDVAAGARLLADSLRSGGKLLVCGNGGSAADVQHFAAELVGRLSVDRLRPSIPAIALTTDTSPCSWPWRTTSA